MLVATPATVLHAFDYLESSRILRLATRDAGVQSVLARGVRRPKSRFGSSLDLFTSGVALLSVRPGRDLQTLTGFDAARPRRSLGADLRHFTGAAALAELTLRFMGDAPNAEAYDAVVNALDALAAAPPDRAAEVVLAGAWHLTAMLGFAPNVDACASCHAPVDRDADAPFSHAGGGVLCARCAARAAAGGRPIPPRARAAIAAWIEGDAHAVHDAQEVSAHQRLLRLFLQAHLSDGGRPLNAYDVWEKGGWSTIPRNAGPGTGDEADDAATNRAGGAAGGLI